MVSISGMYSGSVFVILTRIFTFCLTFRPPTKTLPDDHNSWCSRDYSHLEYISVSSPNSLYVCLDT